MAKRRQSSGALLALLLLICIVVGLVLGFFAYAYYRLPESDTRPTGFANGDVEITFLELGNKYTGDCTYIRVGTVDVLIDAGSRTDSVSTIATFLNEHMQDDVLDYVIVTHAHQDHYAGFATSASQDSLFDLFTVGTIIDFARTNQKETSTMYSNYLRERQEEIDAGATHYTARDCIEQNKATFSLSADVSMQVLDSKYYYEDSSSENDYSVCLLFTQGDFHYLFTGDLEANGEAALVERNSLPEVVLYKAGHHGSKTSSSTALLEVIKPKVVCVCCCAGSPEYTQTDANQFPTQEFVDRVAPYTQLVYVTTLCTDYSANQFESMNGNITFTVSNGEWSVTCSASDKILKEWDWFKEHRTTPQSWK
jgi:competence protein ComEC